MDRGSITADELEYEYLRSLCDLAIAYRRIGGIAGITLPRIESAIGFLEDQLDRLGSDFGDLEIVL